MPKTLADGPLAGPDHMTNRQGVQLWPTCRADSVQKCEDTSPGVASPGRLLGKPALGAPRENCVSCSPRAVRRVHFVPSRGQAPPGDNAVVTTCHGTDAAPGIWWACPSAQGTRGRPGPGFREGGETPPDPEPLRRADLSAAASAISGENTAGEAAGRPARLVSGSLRLVCFLPVLSHL